MDDNNIESLQQKYYEALESKDSEKIEAATNAIEAALSGQGVPQEQVTAQIDPEPAPDNSTEEIQQVAQGSETNVEPTAKDGEPAPSQTDDWLGSLDPKIRSNVEQLLQQNQQLIHQRKSDAGRVAAFQSRYEELRKKAVQQEELLKRLQSSSTAQPQGQRTAAPVTKPISIEDDPDLKAIAETDEQLARAMLKREALLRSELEEMRSTLNQFQSEFVPLKQTQEDLHTQRELQRLEQMVPNAVEIFRYKDPETGVNYWEDWVQRQPRAIREAAESLNADEVAPILRLHIMEMQQYFGFNNQPVAQPQQPTQQVDQSKVQAVQQERERKLQAQPVGSASIKPPQNAQPSFEQIMSSPELLEKYQRKIYEEELKKKGIIR